MTNRVEPAFAQFLRDGGIPEDKIEEFVGIAERFEAFLAAPDEAGSRRTPTAQEVNAFSALLVQEELNTWDNYVALARYGRFLKSNEVYVAVVELLDGSEALGNLHEKLGSSLGEEKRDEIFAGIELPPLGTPSSQKPGITQTVMERLERMVDPETCQEILSDSLRNLEDEWYLEGRKKYLEAGSLDEYLDRKGQEFIAQLGKLKREGKLFFTQEITDEVIDFVQSHPEIRQGVREGNILYEAKIPYMTQEYLAETDEQMKRYYYCHCPWVRESLKEGDVNVSPTFCHCSAGFHKKSWEVIFDQPLKAEMVESVLKGDQWCKFAIHLPEGVVQGTAQASTV
jgi:hypothetical protein